MVKIHINRHIIASNQKKGENKPPITVIRGNKREYGHRVEFVGNAVIVYCPQKPLSCGAKLWIEADDAIVTRYDVETIEERLEDKAAIADTTEFTGKTLCEMTREERHALLYGDSKKTT